MTRDPWFRLMFNRWTGVALAFGGLLLFAPPSVLRHTWVGEYLVSLVKGVFPIIDEYAKLSSNGAQVEIFLSILFLSIPAVFVATWVAWSSLGFDSTLKTLFTSYEREKKRLVAVGLPLLLIGLPFGIMGVAKDPSFCRGCTSDNRIGLLIVSFYGLLVWCAVARIAIWFYSNIRSIFSENHQILS
jgi:TM2 domain-containing membrane protein YozV